MSPSATMQRAAFIRKLSDASVRWDVVIIGGGATGLGAAVDAASRGYKTLLLEQSDFAKGTSSRSTKLIHGGVRYLQQGDVSLVMEALRERGLLMRNAKHLATELTFIVPCYKWWERPYYGLGLKIYNVLSRDLSLGKSGILSANRVIDLLPAVAADKLRGGVLYYDGQFDDSRLAVNLAQTAATVGASVINYARVDEILKEDDRSAGVVATDVESGRRYEIEARAVINATGVFADSIRRMDQPAAEPVIRPSQGIHLVLDRRFLPGGVGLMVPRTEDGRVLFAIPFHGSVVLGTTDTPVDAIDLEPQPRAEEIDFLLDHAARYLNRAPKREDILSIFVGLRPLVSAGAEVDDTSAISRDHVLLVSKSGLVTITGGKWTTYRQMAEDAVDKAAEVGGLLELACRTRELPIHGSGTTAARTDHLSVYGTDAERVEETISSVQSGRERLHPRLPYLQGEVHWAAENEMARTVEDVLARRTRALLLDARASIEAAPAVAAILAQRLGRHGSWEREQVRSFTELADGYLPPQSSTSRRNSKNRVANA